MNIPETEPKITLEVTQYLQIHKGIQYAVKHLKRSRKECLAKNNYSERHYNLFDRDVNAVELWNIPVF